MSTKRKADGHPKPTSKPRIMKSGGSRAESERDSGFSDAGSEHMSAMDTTDSEDSQRPKSACSRAQPSQLAVVSGSYSSLSPMIIMNNVLLKQPGDNPPALKRWGFSPTVEVVQPVVQQPQVVFLQPMVAQQASSVSKDASSRHRRPKKYLPILKSYPKIAPHPGDSSSSSGRGGASSSSFSSSSSSSGSEKASSVVSSHRERSHRDNRDNRHNQTQSSSPGASTIGLPPPSTSLSPLLQHRLSLPVAETSECSSSPARPPPSISESEVTPAPSPSPSHHGDQLKAHALPPLLAQPTAGGDGGSVSCQDDDDENKRKRFCNTYNILSKSGLLDITLRTKELLRQNRRTQSDLDKLKEHTDLFLQALRSGDASMWGVLQVRLQEEDKEKEKERCNQSRLTAD